MIRKSRQQLARFHLLKLSAALGVSVIFFGSACCVAAAVRQYPAKIPFKNMPEQVRASVLLDISDVCGVGAGDAKLYTQNIRALMGDVDGDGRIDYAVDEGSISCSEQMNPAVAVFFGNSAGGYSRRDHHQASLMYGPEGFAWLQGRCRSGYLDYYVIESYVNGVRKATECMQENWIDKEVSRRHLRRAF